MAIGENIGFNRDCFARDAFYCESSGVDFGAHVFNDDTPSSVGVVQIQHIEPALFESSNEGSRKRKRENAYTSRKKPPSYDGGQRNRR